MSDTPVDTVADALLAHRRVRSLRSHVIACGCGTTVTAHGDQWECHLADVAVSALVQAGFTPARPARPVAPSPGVVVARYNADADARWRAAALQVVVAFDAPDPMPQLASAGRDMLRRWWPSLHAAVWELVSAKRALLAAPPPTSPPASPQAPERPQEAP